MSELDRVSLIQALIDTEAATARVIDLTERLVDARQQIVSLRGELEGLRIEYFQYKAEQERVQASRGIDLPSGSGHCGMLLASKPSRWRVLVALLVYNGEELVRPCLSSLSRLDGPHEVDVLILDDASPAPGWSERCSALAADLGFGYYRTPRNLGIPRNMNLGLLRAIDSSYDAVTLNSDTVVPTNLVSALVDPLLDDHAVSSVTAWSNSVSIYSLDNYAPDLVGQSQEQVDWISRRLEAEFSGQTFVIPSAVGFAMAIPTAAIADVGLMDPVFGRGYSEEIDWCLRSHTLGYRSVLAPSCFVYHAGSGVNKVEGLVGGAGDRAHAHQAIIDAVIPSMACRSVRTGRLLFRVN